MKHQCSAESVRIISALVKGCSIRSAACTTGIAKNTVLKLLAEIRKVCADYHDKHVRGVKAKRDQAEKISSFVGSKEKNLPQEIKSQLGRGDTWTWVGIEIETKLVFSCKVGHRDIAYATEFINDLADRVVNRLQLTTDGLRA